MSSSERLKRILENRALFASADQICMSAAGFLQSLFVLNFGGVTSLGLYSFVMVFIHLGHGAVASILHGQMTLRIAGSNNRIQESYFRVALHLNSAVVLSVFVLSMVLQLFTAGHPSAAEHLTLSILGVITFGFYSFYDLFKRYLYLNGLQRTSFYLTFRYAAILFSLLGLLVIVDVQSESLLMYVLAANSLAFGVVLTLNTYCIDAFFTGKKLSAKNSGKLFLGYLEQGRFALGGTVLTWLQNQSITPILMVFSGPLVVGYFNIARLIMMPVMVVNTGLLASALPQLRKLVKNTEYLRLNSEIKKFALINLCLSLAFLSTLLVSHTLGISDRFIPNYRDGLPFLLVWSFVILVLTYRTWVTQHFIVRMKFIYLLVTSMISTAITFASIFIGYFLFENFYVVAASVVLGDIFLLLVFHRKLATAEFDH